MASDGEYVELGTCLEMVIDHRGKTPKKLGADWVERGVPTISAKNVNGGRLVAEDAIRYVSHEVYKRWMKDDVKRGDCFLVSEGATLGECMLWDEDYPVVLGQRIFCLRANPTVLYPRYLYSYMTSANFQSEIIARATGTSVDGLRQTEVLKMKIKLLPMEHQRQIGDTLYFLNTKIELNRRMNETLEGLARAIFQSWFVDFDPVRAQRDGLPPPARSPATAALFPDSFEDSELGKIPKGWRTIRWGEIATLEYGKSLRDYQAGVGRYVVFGTNGRIGRHDDALCNSEGIIIGRKGAYRGVHFSPEPFFVIDTAFYLKPKADLDLKWAYFELLNFDINNMDSGSAIPSTSRDDFYSIPVNVPPVEIQRCFGRIVTALFAKKFGNERESVRLAAIRDALLPKLLSGEIRVADAERLVEDSV